MNIKEPLQKKRGLTFAVVIVISLAIAFLSGFAYAKASENTKWVGWLVYYQNSPSLADGMRPYPGSEDLLYSKNIVLGLRKDGVVVWKKTKALR